MAKNKNDLRVRYTLSAIKKSFITLLLDKHVTKITVKEICEHAGINRATFYAHYADQYALLRSIEESLVADLREYLGNITPNGLVTPTSQKILILIMEYIQENIEICTVLLGQNTNHDFMQDILDLVRDELITDSGGIVGVPQEDIEYIFSYIANGSIGMIKHWMEHGMKKSPAEIADLIWALAHAKELAEKSK